jgi:hypothetical protein
MARRNLRELERPARASGRPTWLFHGPRLASPVCDRDRDSFDTLHWCRQVRSQKWDDPHSLDNLPANFKLLITVICRP